MIIDKNVWDEVGGIVEATFVNIVHKSTLPKNFDKNELKSICYLECGYLIGRYKPGPIALTSYIYEFLYKRVVTRAWKEWHKAQEMLLMLKDETVAQEKDDEEAIVHHQHGEADLDEYKSLAAHLEDKDLFEQIIKIADRNGLGDVARMLGHHSQAEIAAKLGITQPAVAQKIAKLRELCKEM